MRRFPKPPFLTVAAGLYFAAVGSVFLHGTGRSLAGQLWVQGVLMVALWIVLAAYRYITDHGWPTRKHVPSPAAARQAADRRALLAGRPTRN